VKGGVRRERRGKENKLFRKVFMWYRGAEGGNNLGISLWLILNPFPFRPLQHNYLKHDEYLVYTQSAEAQIWRGPFPLSIHLLSASGPEPHRVNALETSKFSNVTSASPQSDP